MKVHVETECVCSCPSDLCVCRSQFYKWKLRSYHLTYDTHDTHIQTHTQPGCNATPKQSPLLLCTPSWLGVQCALSAGHPLGRPKEPVFPWEFPKNCPFTMAAFLGVSYLRVGSWPFWIKYAQGQVWTKEKYKSGVFWNAGKSLTNWRSVIISPLGSFSEVRWPHLLLCLPVPVLETSLAFTLAFVVLTVTLVDPAQLCPASTL